MVCAPPGIGVACYLDLMALPQFNPDDDHDPLPREVASLRRVIGSADPVLFCNPEYAGTLPGSFKNLLVWMVSGAELTAKPVAWVNAAADHRRGEGAHSTLATVLGYVQATVIQVACRRVPVARDQVRAEGLITNTNTRAQIAAAIHGDCVDVVANRRLSRVGLRRAPPPAETAIATTTVPNFNRKQSPGE